MSELIYIDTNVWLDLFLSRKDKLRPLGDFAFELLKSSLECNYTIVLSDWVIKECNHIGFGLKIRESMKLLQEKDKVIFIKSTKDEIILSKKYNHWQDYLHALLAQKGDVSFLVTRNIRDFADDWYSFEVMLPEEL